MKLNFTFENIKATALEKELLRNKLSALVKYAQCLKRKQEVVLGRVFVKKMADVDGAGLLLSLNLSVPHATCHAEVIADSLPHALDRLVPKIKRQLSRYKAKRVEAKIRSGMRMTIRKFSDSLTPELVF